MNRRQTAGGVAVLALMIAIMGTAVAQNTAQLHPAANIQLAATTTREPEPHAARALTDLQFARWLLANNRDEKATDPNEDKALYETNQAIADVGKLLQLEPSKSGSAPSDVIRGRDDRLHAALRYLNHAFSDLKAAEDENPANAWRTAAYNRTWDAMHYTELALGVDRKADVGQCTALRKALTDLTTSREDLNEALRAFGSNRGDAYNDTLRLRNQTNATITDLTTSVSRQCGSTS